MYEYNAEVVRVYDGDSIRLDVDLGFGVFLKNESVRLADINAPEIRGETQAEGYGSRDRLIAILSSANNVCRIKTKKGKERGKYGRIIAYVYVGSDERGWTNVNEQLIEEGYATAYGK